MIGNLLLAIGLTCGLGAVALGNVDSDYVDTPLNVSGGGESISNVTGEKAYLYYADTFNFNVNTQGYFSVYAGNISTRSYRSDEVAMSSYINSQQSFIDVCNNAMSLKNPYANYDFVIVAEDLTDIFLVRFYVKSDSPVENIEILGANSNGLFYGMGYGTLSSTGLLESDNTWVLLHDSLSYSSTAEDGNSSGTNPYSKFNCFYIWYDMPNNNTGLNMTFNLFGSMNATYQNGYEVGYTSGYTDGSGVGYTTGYQEGLATAQGGDFNSLFNSVADTPLRFLYGIFSFDLFGTSMIIIILSLLTGIILFGIIKKFWK